MSKRSGLLFAALVLLVGAGFWWVSGVGLDNSPPVHPESAWATDELAPVVPDPAAPNGQGEALAGSSLVEAETAVERAEVVASPGVVVGRVLDSTGRPLESAEVSVTVWTEDLAQFYKAWMSAPDELLESASAYASTHADGTFRFGSLPPEAETVPVVLWVTHPGHLAHGQVFETGQLLLALQPGLELRLEASMPMTCQVREAGAPAAGARISQRARNVAATIYSRVDDMPNAEWVFHRTVTADAAGRAALAPADLIHEVTATHGELESVPWFGPERPLVELELLPTFFVEGVCTVDGELNEAWGGQHVELISRSGPLREPLKRLFVRSDRTFGPERVPLGRFAESVARFVGGDLVPVESAFSSPAPGERVFLELHSSAGATGYFTAYDREANAIIGAQASVQWTDKGTVQTRLYPSDGEGLIQVPGLPEGLVRATLSAKGFRDTGVEPFFVPELEPQLHWTHLLEARTLSGRCLFEGKPVEDFQVFLWGELQSQLRTQVTVTNSKDGRFEFSAAPNADIAMLAFAPGIGISNMAMLAQSVDYEVELHLVPGRQIHGRVVDHEGHALSGAYIVPVLPNKLQASREIGPGVESGPDGAFGLGGVSSLGGLVRIGKDGFAERLVEVPSSGVVDLDVGEVALIRTETLRVQVTLPLGETSGFIGTLDYTGVPRVPLSSSGEANIESFRPGKHTFVVEAEDWDVEQHVPLVLATGEPWDFEFDMQGQAVLEVKYIGDDSHEALVGYAKHYDSLGRWIETSFGFDEDMQRRVPGICPGPVQMILKDAEDGSRGYFDFVLGPNEKTRLVELSLSDHRVKVLVVDSQGAPVESLDIQIQRPGSSSLLTIVGTGQDGLVFFPGLEPNSDYYALAQGSAGGQASWPLETPADEEQTVELVFDPSHELVLRFVEEGEPRPGVEGWLTFSLGGLGFGTTATSGVDGRMRFQKLGLGGYVVGLSGDGFLPFEVYADAGGAEIVQEVYSQTDVTLRVIHEDGSLAAGAPLGLVHDVLGIELATGLAEGWLQSSSGGLATGPNGELTLKGLPRGSYSWSAGGAEGGLTVSRDGASRPVLVIP